MKRQALLLSGIAQCTAKMKRKQVSSYRLNSNKLQVHLFAEIILEVHEFSSIKVDSPFKSII